MYLSAAATVPSGRPGTGCRTSLLISHRLGAVRDADRIVVLSDGVVAESGTNDELMSADAGYAKLFRMRADGYAPDVATDVPGAQ